MTSGNYYQTNVVPAEVATELLNSARAMIFERIYAIENSYPGSATELTMRAASLKRLQDGIDVRNPAHSQSLIEKWGPLLKDQQAFWRELRSGERSAA